MMLAIKRLLGHKKIVLFGSIVYTLLITVAFLLPASGLLPKVNFGIPMDKLIHVGIHGVLSLIWLFAFYMFYPQNTSKKWVMMVVISCISYGIIIEVFQGWFVASRQADGFDVMANVVGTLLGMMLFQNIRNRIKT